jgi:hypothetical protein
MSVAASILLRLNTFIVDQFATFFVKAVAKLVNQIGRTEKTLITPAVDAVCGGGLSLVVAAIVILYGWLTEAGMNQMLIAIQVYLLTDLLINGPHFMASYRLLYTNQENYRKHPLVTILAPVIAVAFIGYVIYWCYRGPAAASEPLTIITILNWIAPVFLGWHYMGQSWGATACFAFLSDLRMNSRERRLIRSGFHALFIYHVAWAYDSMGFVQGVFAEEEAGKYLMEAVMSICRLGVFVTFALGLLGFRELSQREEKRIPVRVWLPWVATFSWYVMVDVHPASFFLLQAFHAFQYLMFPVRVEINEYTNPRHRWRHLFFYYIALVLVGLVAFEWSDLFSASDAMLPVATATMMVINLHHYFIDAVIWKIRDPKVRQSLFSHVEPARA